MRKYYIATAALFVAFMLALLVHEFNVFPESPTKYKDEETLKESYETSVQKEDQIIGRATDDNKIKSGKVDIEFEFNKTELKEPSFKLIREGNYIYLSHVKKMDCERKLKPETISGPDFDMYATNIIEKVEGNKSGEDCYFFVKYTFGPLEPDYYNFRIYDYENDKTKEVWQMASLVPENASTKIEEEEEREEFCGVSLKGECETEEDCIVSGCQNQVCQSIHEQGIKTTCYAKECFIAENYNLSCQCVEGKCAWALENSE